MKRSLEEINPENTMEPRSKKAKYWHLENEDKVVAKEGKQNKHPTTVINKEKKLKGKKLKQKKRDTFKQIKPIQKTGIAKTGPNDIRDKPSLHIDVNFFDHTYESILKSNPRKDNVESVEVKSGNTSNVSDSTKIIVRKLHEPILESNLSNEGIAKKNNGICPSSRIKEADKKKEKENEREKEDEDKYNSSEETQFENPEKQLRNEYSHLKEVQIFFSLSFFFLLWYI
ncbi:hypothetical protein RFI_18070 [Reticulomyxa filosa]|uniref:Uncharacterized protein n=1 Tax=Reticulomyxa filosa TaxID=46433 RepID=X6N1G1_RETFI|nr:hypothetical protein RFI_18070 [Reticulomyxa filosa]|eukprot:ETO19162.1 hypothetical protein RFI_18070 [Reticulomyxa filosa]